MEDIKEKTADEIMKELGYEKQNNPGIEIKYIKDFVTIRFWKPDKKIIKQDEENGRYLGITMQELQAINKKCKELNWLGDE